MSFIATNKVYASTNKATIVWIETELFLTPGVDASRVYVRALALGCFYSHISTRTFRMAQTVSLDSCVEIKRAPSVASLNLAEFGGRCWKAMLRVWPLPACPGWHALADTTSMSWLTPLPVCPGWHHYQYVLADTTTSMSWLTPLPVCPGWHHYQYVVADTTTSMSWLMLPVCPGWHYWHVLALHALTKMFFTWGNTEGTDFENLCLMFVDMYVWYL